MIEAIIFVLLAALTLVPALLVVTAKNVFHSALWLVLSLTGVAGLYAMLAADFLFAVQLLVYVGGIMVLLLFVVLLSGKPSDWAARQVNEKSWAAAIFALFLTTALGTVIHDWSVSAIASDPVPTTGMLGSLLFKEMLLPFEVVSLVLLVSLIGAVFFSVRKSS